jgi:MarR family 2-MHQ and catechol resistance regulon transcriptional repressor
MGTKHKGTKEEERALNTYIKLQRVSNAVTAKAHAHLAEEKLTVSQFGALEALYHLGPLCQKELGQKILKTGGNITLVVDNLEKRKLVQRRRSVEDRRYIEVHLVDKGRELIARIFPRHVANIVKIMNSLKASDQVELGRLCKELGMNVMIPKE